MISSGAIPRDSLVVTGRRFVDKMWGDAPRPAPNAPDKPDSAEAVDDGSLRSSCMPDGVCTVEGTVTWRAHSDARKATSKGRARFKLTFATRGRLILVSEWSEVFSRQ